MADQPRKRCRTCGVPKAPTEFYRRTRSPDGRQAACIPCSRAQLDAATARRRAAARAERIGAGPSLAEDFDRAEALIGERAADVLDVLRQCTLDGEVAVLTRLADMLCGDDCPDGRAADGESACILHEMADLYEYAIAQRYPALARPAPLPA